MAEETMRRFGSGWPFSISVVASLLMWTIPAAAGPFPAVFELSSLDGTNGFRIDSESGSSVAGDSLVFSVARADVNGDGIADVIIGAPLASPNGRDGAG